MMEKKTIQMRLLMLRDIPPKPLFHNSLSTDAPCRIKAGAILAIEIDMIEASLTLITSKDRVQEMIRALRRFMGPTQVEPGCLSCCIYQSVDKPTVILYLEHWSSWETLALHVQTMRYVQLLEVMEASLETPLMSFHNMQEARGMEYLKSVRGSPPITERA